MPQLLSTQHQSPAACHGHVLETLHRPPGSGHPEEQGRTTSCSEDRGGGAGQPRVLAQDPESEGTGHLCPSPRAWGWVIQTPREPQIPRSMGTLAIWQLRVAGGGSLRPLWALGSHQCQWAPGAQTNQGGKASPHVSTPRETLFIQRSLRSPGKELEGGDTKPIVPFTKQREGRAWEFSSIRSTNTPRVPCKEER